MEEENECNEKLIAKEKLIHVFLKAAVEERVAAQSLPTANAHLDEVMQFYKLEREKLQGVSLMQFFQEFYFNFGFVQCFEVCINCLFLVHDHYKVLKKSLF